MGHTLGKLGCSLLWRPLRNAISFQKSTSPAVTRIRTWVTSATTKGTNHYTITATKAEMLLARPTHYLVHVQCWHYQKRVAFYGLSFHKYSNWIALHHAIITTCVYGGKAIFTTKHIYRWGAEEEYHSELIHLSQSKHQQSKMKVQHNFVFH